MRKKDKPPRDHVSRRKALTKRAKKRFPWQKMGWVGGRLYFLDTKELVPNIEAVSKPGSEVKSWEEVFPKHGEKPMRVRNNPYMYASRTQYTWF